ncbi:hypothetical protein VNO80_23013 [Phaseolus coccineus]|uniref:PB1-like domain-containing protein n=1 Tax=Phaseolus coccineus TaxID=3886 RepID=A0AAN9QS96_PHACN
MGNFGTSPLLHYEIGEKHVFHGLDSYTWSYFEAIEIMKEFKYDSEVRLWWKLKTGRMDTHLRQFIDDKDVMELVNYAENRNEDVVIYVQHIMVTKSDIIEFIGLALRLMLWEELKLMV